MTGVQTCALPICLQEGELVALPGDVDLRDGMDVIVVNTESANLRRTGHGLLA